MPRWLFLSRYCACSTCAWKILLSSVCMCVLCVTAGSVDPTACGSSDVYCPPASAQPVTVSVGYYSTGGDNATVYSQQLICPRGHYCVAGVAFGCPGGTFRGSLGGMQELECSICPPGFFCGQCPRLCDCEPSAGHRLCSAKFDSCGLVFTDSVTNARQGAAASAVNSRKPPPCLPDQQSNLLHLHADDKSNGFEFMH